MRGLVAPNGRPVSSQAQVPVTHDQMSAVTQRLVDAQFAALLNLGVPPLKVIEVLIDLVTNLLGRFDPPGERRRLIADVAAVIEKDAMAKARRREIEAAVARPPPSEPILKG